MDPQRLKTADLQYFTEEKLKYKEQKENFPPDVLDWEAFNQKNTFEVNLQVIPVLWFGITEQAGLELTAGMYFWMKLDFLVDGKMHFRNTPDVLQLLTSVRTIGPD